MQAGNSPKRRSKNLERYGQRLYDYAEPRAHTVKVFLQMAVGVGTLLALGWHLFSALECIPDAPFADWQPLRIVAIGLEYAAGIELAYMLFTDGPDEAIQPLILGLSAATLLSVSSGISAEQISPMAIIAAPILTMTIAVLLWIQRAFFSTHLASAAPAPITDNHSNETNKGDSPATLPAPAKSTRSRRKKDDIDA